MPAQRLEGATAAGHRKGRLQVGADADIVVFDPATFEDKASYVHANVPSVGARYVLVAGTMVVDGGRIVEDVAPGFGRCAWPITELMRQGLAARDIQNRGGLFWAPSMAKPPAAVATHGRSPVGE